MPKRWPQMGDGVKDYWDFQDVEGLVTSTVTIDIPAKSLVKEVLALQITASNAATSDTLKAGDGNDDDGYLTAVDIKAAAGTLVGDVSAEEGAYRFATVELPGGKYYPSADTLDIVNTVVGAKTAGKTRVFAHIIVLDAG